MSDKGYDGAVIRLTGEFGGIEHCAEGEGIANIRAGAGALLSQVAAFARDNGLSGMEFASGIPGTVGGALVMNAGAFGGQMEDICRQAVVYRPKDGSIVTISGSDLGFDYRQSCFKGADDIILEAVLCLTPADREVIGAAMEELSARRRARQPLEFRSAGSTFKRPEGEGLYAGKLIEEAGLKGMRLGGARISEKHCGFIVNTGGASSADIYALIRLTIDRVREHSGVELQPEVLFLGDME